MMKIIFAFALCMGVVVAGTVPAMAVLFTGTSGYLEASVEFKIVSGDLVVTLTNESSQDVMNPSDVLTAVFFSINDNPALSSATGSALLNSGSSVAYDPDGQPTGGIVGGEWGYKTGLAGAPGGATQGISSSGFGLFGDATFPGSNLAGPGNGALDGLQYGILSAGDDTSTGNTGGIINSGGLIKNSVVFTLDGNLPSDFDLVISKVSFQYGTDLTEPNVPGTPVPEPGTLLLLGSGLAGLYGYRSRKLGKK